MSKDPRVYLAQILECIERIVKYVAGGKEAFFTERLIQDAVIRNFEIIGERPGGSQRHIDSRIPRFPGALSQPFGTC